MPVGSEYFLEYSHSHANPKVILPKEFYVIKSGLAIRFIGVELRSRYNEFSGLVDLFEHRFEATDRLVYELLELSEY